MDSSGKTTYDTSYVDITNAGSQTAQVLLVDDDNGASYEAYYQAALDALGIVYDHTSTPPNNAIMSGYEAVVWFTGNDWQTTLTSTDQTELGNYLAGGGNLFISGQDIGYDLGASNPFINN